MLRSFVAVYLAICLIGLSEEALCWKAPRKHLKEGSAGTQLLSQRRRQCSGAALPTLSTTSDRGEQRYSPPETCLVRRKSSSSRQLIRRGPSPSMLKILAYRSCAPSMLDVTSIQDIKDSFLFLAVIELFACNNDGHSGVAVHRGVSLLPRLLNTSCN